MLETLAMFSNVQPQLQPHQPSRRTRWLWTARGIRRLNQRPYHPGFRDKTASKFQATLRY